MAFWVVGLDDAGIIGWCGLVWDAYISVSATARYNDMRLRVCNAFSSTEGHRTHLHASFNVC